MAGYLDPVGIGIVFGGSALVAVLRSGFADTGRAISALAPLVRADSARDGEAARVVVGRIERLAEVRSLFCADRIEATHPFLRLAARRLSDTPDAAEFARWGEEALAERAIRHGAAQSVWRGLADAAPAMGLIGTVIGLIGMFLALDDPARIGPAMALALTTTLYGVVLANVVAGPIAARLERLSAAEQAWQAWVVRRLARLAEAERGRAMDRAERISRWAA